MRRSPLTSEERSYWAYQPVRKPAVPTIRNRMWVKTEVDAFVSWGFSMFMAGAGIKGGQVVGETDEIGLRAVKGKAHIHASILQLVGLDHRETTYLHNGRNERPTINGGVPIDEIVG